MPFDAFPWFRYGARRLANVAQPHPKHPCWPDLDIDLAVESIRNPEQFPVVQRAR